MGRDLRVGLISPYSCHVFGDSRPEQSSSFSDVVALSATAPDPVNDSRCFLPWQWVSWSHYLTPHGGLRPVRNCVRIGNLFGRDALRSARRWETFAFREASTYAQIRFLHRCLDNNVLPKCVSCKPPVNTELARRAVFQHGRRMMRVLLQDCHARLRKYRQRIDQEKARCCEFMGENGTNLLQQKLTERAREQRATRDAALGNKFHKLPDPTSSRGGTLVHNLSLKELTKEQVQVLRHEASFNTADAKPINMIAAVESVINLTEAAEETKNLIRHQVSSLLMTQKPREKLTKVQRDALRELKADKDIVIVPPDKGSSTVVLDRTDYFQKAKNLLEDRQFYVPCETNPVKTLTCEINATLLGLDKSDAITPTDRRMAGAQETALARFYGLPKVHKEGATLRPILSLQGTPTYGLAKWLFRRLKFLTADSDTTVCSSTQFLEKLKEVSLLPNEVMVSFDVTSLFTSIPQDLAIETVQLLLRNKYDETENRLGHAQVLQLLRFCLKTYFTFDGTIYEQVKGTPMGSPILGFIAEAVLQRLESLVFQHQQTGILGSKGIPVYSASRLQRWATILLGYDFDIRYCRTTDFGQADALSRLISNQQEPEEDTVIAAISIEDGVRRQLSDAIRGIPVTAADIRRATEQDPVLRQAITYVQTCWPTTALAGDLRQLFLRRASLSVVDSCLIRMKSIARSFAYWPGIDGDIDDLVRRCSRCQQAAKMPPRQPPIPWQPPERPWSRVHIDFAGPLNGVSYLILVDAYSKWPKIAPLNPATASSTIAFLRRIFSQHGLPEVLVSDNGSQFTSSSFEDFCRQHNIQHLCSPPYHPQSNGQAERFVDTFKRALLKARGEGTTDEIVQAFLFSYRTTPNPASPGGVSPAEALMGWKLRTTFHALVPTGAQPAQTSPVSRSKLSIGTPVFVRDYRAGFPDWIEATVVSHRGSILFDVDVGDEIWVRHHNQIRRRHCSNTTGLDPAPSLPLDILLDIFAIPADRSVPEPTAALPSDVPPSVSVTAPGSPDNKPQLRRRTNRVRRSTLPMQINPRQKRY
nr:unnamed protein product [Spirometra erinaceieuropaei]